jgi:YD repeat-containing protein
VQNRNGKVGTYTYDPENRLTVVQAGAVYSTYTYDGDGQRRSAIEPSGSLTTMVRDGSLMLQTRS